MHVLLVLLAAAVALASVAVVKRIRDLPTRRALDAVRSAPNKAIDAGSFAFRLTMTLTPPNGSDADARTTQSKGELDAERNTSHTVLFPVLAPVPLELLSDGSVAYLSIPVARRDRFGGKRWVRVDAGSSAAAQGAALGPLPDPLTFLDALRGASRPATKEGREQVGAVASRRYRAMMSLDRLNGRVPEARRRALARFGHERLPLQVWLDTEGRPVRAVMKADLGRDGVVTATLDAYGEPIMIGIPPADAVVPSNTLAEALRIVAS